MTQKTIFSILILVSFSFVTYAQLDCVVKKEAINKTYKGECKKSLAHGVGEAFGEVDNYKGNFKKGFPSGKGVYTWGNGNVYEGSFVKGQMDGEGELIIKSTSGELIVQKGFFKKDEYIGAYKNPYKILSQQGLRKVDFNEYVSSADEVKIKIYYNGKIITPYININDFNNSPTEKKNDALILKNVHYPLKHVELSFKEGNFTYRLTFEIYKKGSWEINISI